MFICDRLDWFIFAFRMDMYVHTFSSRMSIMRDREWIFSSCFIHVYLIVIYAFKYRKRDVNKNINSVGWFFCCLIFFRFSRKINTIWESTWSVKVADSRCFRALVVVLLKTKLDWVVLNWSNYWIKPLMKPHSTLCSGIPHPFTSTSFHSTSMHYDYTQSF